MTDTRWLTVYFPDQVKHRHQQLLTQYKMPPPPPRSSLPVKTSRPSSRNSVVAEKMNSSASSRTNRTLPPRPAMGPQPSGRVASSKTTSGRVEHSHWSRTVQILCSDWSGSSCCYASSLQPKDTGLKHFLPFPVYLWPKRAAVAAS